MIRKWRKKRCYLDINVKDANMNGYQEAMINQLFALNVKHLTGIRRESNDYDRLVTGQLFRNAGVIK